MDLIIRQATETGIFGVVPVESQHCIPRGATRGASRDNTKHERRLRIARQAMQQSGSPVAPEINNTIPFSGFPAVWEHYQAGIHEDKVAGLFFHQVPIGDMSLEVILSVNPKLIGIFIGPEGGFSEKEVTTLLQSSFQPVYIRTNVLRTETAALYAIAAVQTIVNMPE
ncbi:MAG: RNA methyltransferase [Spirochaetales bacterium]|nr:RNA methyltransferase [Spirochaetales bacterium]